MRIRSAQALTCSLPRCDARRNAGQRTLPQGLDLRLPSWGRGARWQARTSPPTIQTPSPAERKTTKCEGPTENNYYIAERRPRNQNSLSAKPQCVAAPNFSEQLLEYSVETNRVAARKTGLQTNSGAAH